MPSKSIVRPFVFVIACVLAAAVVWADAPTTAPATTTAATSPALPIDQPAIKADRAGKPATRFVELHHAFLWRGKEGPMGVLFLGDSITEGWMRGGADVWRERYWKYQPADFGIGGDRTEHVLWRIDNGELDGIQPKVVVLMIGTNNSKSNTAEEIAAADKRIVEEIHGKLPETKLLLLAIFPRAEDPKDPLRDKIKAVNAELAKLDDGFKTRYLDIGEKFLDADGKIPKGIMNDFLHPTAKGYQIWADAMQPLLDEMMR